MKKLQWYERARVDIRRLDQATATRILKALHRLIETGEGDLTKIQGSENMLRLRVGDYRVQFDEEPAGTLRIYSVRHRKEAYR